MWVFYFAMLDLMAASYLTALICKGAAMSLICTAAIFLPGPTLQAKAPDETCVALELHSYADGNIKIFFNEKLAHIEKKEIGLCYTFEPLANKVTVFNRARKLYAEVPLDKWHTSLVEKMKVYGVSQDLVKPSSCRQLHRSGLPCCSYFFSDVKLPSDGFSSSAAKARESINDYEMVSLMVPQNEKVSRFIYGCLFLPPQKGCPISIFCHHKTEGKDGYSLILRKMNEISLDEKLKRSFFPPDNAKRSRPEDLNTGKEERKILEELLID